MNKETDSKQKGIILRLERLGMRIIMDTEKSYIEEKEAENSIQIADDVVAVIAGLAATEVEGVAAVAGNITADIMGKVGIRTLTKGVKVDIEEKAAKVSLKLVMLYGYNIPLTCSQVQEKVKSTIENMTGLLVEDVSVHIVDVSLDKIQRGK